MGSIRSSPGAPGGRQPFGQERARGQGEQTGGRWPEFRAPGRESFCQSLGPGRKEKRGQEDSCMGKRRRPDCLGFLLQGVPAPSTRRPFILVPVLSPGARGPGCPADALLILPKVRWTQDTQLGDGVSLAGRWGLPASPQISAAGGAAGREEGRATGPPGHGRGDPGLLVQTAPKEAAPESCQPEPWGRPLLETPGNARARGTRPPGCSSLS